MSVKVLSVDAKRYLEQRVSELRHAVEISQNSHVKTSRTLFLVNLEAEIAKKLHGNSDLFQTTNEEGTVIGGSKDAVNAIFKKEIRGTVVLCRNAFFEVRGFYSEDEAVMMVQDKIKRNRNEIEYLKLCDAPRDQPNYERI